MPTYDYGCGACGHVFEVFEGIGAGGARCCPGCGKRRARRRIGIGAGLVFRGEGFYSTDYKNGGSRKRSKGSSDSASGKPSDGCSESTGKEAAASA